MVFVVVVIRLSQWNVADGIFTLLASKCTHSITLHPS